VRTSPENISGESSLSIATNVDRLEPTAVGSKTNVNGTRAGRTILELFGLLRGQSNVAGEFEAGSEGRANQ